MNSENLLYVFDSIWTASLILLEIRYPSVHYNYLKDKRSYGLKFVEYFVTETK